MNVKNLKDEVKKVLIEDVEKAFNYLDSKVIRGTDFYDNFVMLRSRLNVNNRKEPYQTDTKSNIDVESNKITKAFLNLVNTLDKDDLQEADTVKPRLNYNQIAEIIMTVNSPKLERFTDTEHWSKLNKIDNWKIDTENSFFEGKGIYSYLLSQNKYGRRNFTVFIDFKVNYLKPKDVFIPISKYHLPMNFGIVLGWSIDSNGRRKYYNLLFSGYRILLEAVGFQTGDEMSDFLHLDNGIPIFIEENRWNSLVIRVTNTVINVIINEVFMYSVRRPDNLYGNIGIRPWRSNFKCRKFEINEN